MFEGDLAHVFMSASQDGLLKIWDRRSNSAVAKVHTPSNASFHSVGSNSRLIAAGTNEDIFFWDVHQLSKPIGHFQECHSEDVTSIKFNS